MIHCLISGIYLQFYGFKITTLMNCSAAFTIFQTASTARKAPPKITAKPPHKANRAKAFNSQEYFRSTSSAYGSLLSR